MKYHINPKYSGISSKFKNLVENFDTDRGKVMFSGRNTIKIFEIDGVKFSVKSFKIPNFINKIFYKYFRKSKAERSFYYAGILQKNGIGTPEPVGFVEEDSGFTFGKSYYISKYVEYDLTYRELVTDTDFPDHEEILRAFTRFTYKLHQNNVMFLDHSPGNTLIKKLNGEYKFYLVDLNRMVFKELSKTERMINFSRLTPKKEMVEIMADEYASIIKKSKTETFERMWFFTRKFQEKFHRKKELKRKLKFWK